MHCVAFELHVFELSDIDVRTFSVFILSFILKAEIIDYSYFQIVLYDLH